MVVLRCELDNFVDVMGREGLLQAAALLATLPVEQVDGGKEQSLWTAGGRQAVF